MSSESKKRVSKTLRLVCIGDTHGFHRSLVLPAGDILIHSGDFDGQSVEQVDDFNDWLESLPYRHKLVIAGNHDLLFDRKPKVARAHLTAAVYLQDSGIRIEGLNFWGSPVNSVMGEEWAFSAERGAKIRKHWDRIPADADVLITHEAPYGTLDKQDILGRHRGCQNLLGTLLRVKPKLHVFGHIHGSYGQESAWNVRLVNCAVVNNQRVLTNAPTVVDLAP
ncbi:metallophosphatase domain-containing protein [Acidipila sp. EB88]|uniref:metallophosphatase domain-containing protein n=1 Tax=Acidipila sp. EB88 TaxID=2305226 RepID=UPI000F603642|nr:metallophosphatase domain-containing protein [Acidipila sp. EB88]RRA50332.1 metallophosphoesterase [Acidipila sp. EB88]RRA50343.1 metallophosphoesterase [Acidipila sp. EB88]